MQTISIIGVGRVGGAFALALPSDKYSIIDLIVRDRDIWQLNSAIRDNVKRVKELTELVRIDVDTLIISTPDSEIDGVVSSLAGLVDGRTFVFHTSGSLSSSILEPLRKGGSPIGSIHPLVSISDSEIGASRFNGSYFCLEGDRAALDRGRMIVQDLGGVPFSIDRDKKALYHAAAVMACGHFVALIELSTGLLARCGMSKADAKTVLMPLVESTLANMRVQSIPDALTGTFARGDVESFERHLAALNAYGDARVYEIYLLLGDISLDLTRERGADPTAVADFRKMISMAKSGTR